jgi:protease-4
MKSFFRTFFASLLAIIVIILIVVGVVAIRSSRKADIEDQSYLVIDLYGDITEYNPPPSFSSVLGEGPETLQRILSNLRKVPMDERLEGVILKISSSNNAGYAKLEEIRNALKRVREGGKKVYGFSDSMNRKTYYLAAACDSIFMPRTAYFSFVGFATVTVHVKETLEKLGIKPNLHRIKDYKGAAELITRSNMSEAVRENRGWMLDEYWDIFTSTLQKDRGIGEQKVKDIMELAVFSSQEAKKFGLIDEVMYWDEFEDMLKHDDQEKLRTVSQSRYAEEDPDDLGLGGDKKIAVIHAQGLIGGRKSRTDPLMGIIMGHESVRSEIKRAREDEDVVAIVFRVDSGGGEALTSDLIGHEIELTTREKPVVASMVDVAASGGYHISYRSTRIVADSTTLTGSIGSINMKFNMKEFYHKMGISHDWIDKGPKAMMYSDLRDFNDDEWERFKDEHWAGFNDWLEDVAEHRGMTFVEAEKLAHGRIWSGRQAEKNGLIDQVGDLNSAIELARELAEIPEDEDVKIVHYPKKKGLMDMILGGGGSLTKSVNYLIYQYIRTDLAETWNMLTERRIWMWDDVEIK